MIYLDEDKLVYTIFGVSKFAQIQNAISPMAPSICEYYLDDLTTKLIDIPFNKSSIQDKIDIYDYTVYLSYDDNIYIEYDSCDLQDANLFV